MYGTEVKDKKSNLLDPQVCSGVCKLAHFFFFISNAYAFPLCGNQSGKSA